MCIMCDGATPDEMRFMVYGHIEKYGWHIVYVENQKRSASWAYTIGLSSRFGHPELAVVGVGMETAASVLNSVGDLVKEGERLAGGEAVWYPDGSHLHLVDVHPQHFACDTFAAWLDYYGALGPPLPEPRAIEVVMPGRQPRLTDPQPITSVRVRSGKAQRKKRPPRNASQRRKRRPKKHKPRRG